MSKTPKKLGIYSFRTLVTSYEIFDMLGKEEWVDFAILVDEPDEKMPEQANVRVTGHEKLEDGSLVFSGKMSADSGVQSGAKVAIHMYPGEKCGDIRIVPPTLSLHARFSDWPEHHEEIRNTS